MPIWTGKVISFKSGNGKANDGDTKNDEIHRDSISFPYPGDNT